VATEHLHLPWLVHFQTRLGHGNALQIGVEERQLILCIGTYAFILWNSLSLVQQLRGE